MTFSKQVENYIGSLPKNKPFFASEAYNKNFINESEQNYYKILERLKKKYILRKCGKGCYYVPKSSKFGTIPISEEEIINSIIEDKTDGFEIGYGLYNKLGLTTQIAKNRVFYSTKINGQNRNIKNITFKYLNINIESSTKKVIEALEVLQNYNKIENMNESMFKEYMYEIGQFYNDSMTEEILKVKTYKKSTIAFLKDVLEEYNIENNLGNYLSKLSKYNIPDWRV